MVRLKVFMALYYFSFKKQVGFHKVFLKIAEHTVWYTWYRTTPEIMVHRQISVNEGYTL